jgi:hypothetical protein
MGRRTEHKRRNARSVFIFIEGRLKKTGYETDRDEGRGGIVPALKSCMGRMALSTGIVVFLSAGPTRYPGGG